MESATFDQIDTRILRVLLVDGRISMQHLSEQIGLSPTPTARRVQRLESVGAITGYGARIDEAALGFDVSVFVSVQLDKQVDDALAAFESAILQFPEVVDCWLMTGNRDYLMRVVATNLSDFEAFLVGKLAKVEGVASIESSIPLRRVKSAHARTP
ncbi:MAG: Lrp/AsnC family transcriptional regulator [Boseongicola sp.]|nr:Lrp/AsnC family transcriptional regulator [Boseongicola sp.]MDE0347945.1 Lrp/AsnC family transcriptional regulator [Boseongicola sp.]